MAAWGDSDYGGSGVPYISSKTVYVDGPLAERKTRTVVTWGIWAWSMLTSF